MEGGETGEACYTIFPMDSPVAFIPIDRRHALARGQTLPDHTRGAALFADISGFTPLTEALSKMLGQQRGAEEISRQLNRVYDALITEVERYGGSVINFAGDAITCWFDGDEGARATASALMMQRAMAQFSSLTLPSGGMVTLAMKAALAGGPVRRFVVGDPAIQLIDVLAGATLGRMSIVEHHANRTEVVLSPECFPAVAESALVLEWRPDRESTTRGGPLYPVIGGLLQPIEARPWPELSAESLTEAQVRPWLLPDLYERFSEGQSKFLAELRPAAALFLRFGGLDYDDDPEAGQKLDAYTRWVQAQIYRYEGFLLQMTVGDKGSYLYAAFGAPLAHDDDPARAVAAAQTLRATPSEFNFITRVQIGLSHGRMRAGPYGGTTRRTYGVLGDDVNLAARLMQSAAPGQVLVSQSIVDSTASAFGWEALAPIKVKGKAQPVAIYQLAQAGPTHYRRAVGRGRTDTAAMVGREAEREQLVGALRNLIAQRQSTVFIIEGEAGIGKTRLLDEVRQAAQAEHAPVFSGVGNAIEKAAYLAWREVFYALFNWETTADEEARRRNILETIGPERAGLAPLLNDVLNEKLFDETDLTRNLTGKPRADSTREVLLSILHQAAQRAPLVLMLEDAHWLDSQSWALALAVQQRIRNAPVLFILATRPLTESLPEFAQLAQAPQVQRLRLQPLPRHDVLALVSQRLGASRLPDSVAALIQSKAEGNPFFSEELAFALRDAGWIEMVGGQCRVAPGVDLNTLVLPDNVQGVITSRIDRLTAPQQLALKLASAIGRAFAFRILRDIHPVEGDKQRLPNYLEVLEQLELTLHAVTPELQYLFKHTITQDVAYNLMLFAQRRELHQAIGEWYEREFAGRLTQGYPVLAHHWGRAAESAGQHIEAEAAARVIHKAVDYLTKAGDQALQISAFREAVSAYETALALTPPHVSPPMSTLGGQGGVRAILLVKLGNTFEAMSDFRSATERLRAGLELARAAADTRLAAEALSGLCWVSARQGAHAEARALAEEAIALARAADDKATMALALRRLGVSSKGDRAAAIRHYEDSLQMYQEIEDQKGIAACLNNLGNMAAGTGDYPSANWYYGDGLTMAREAGERLMIATFLGNLGEIARRQNDFDAATRYLQDALTTYKEIGAREGVATNMLNLGWLAAARKDASAALEYYRDALAESMAIGALPRALGAISGMAGLSARFGDHQRAAELLGLALSHPASNAAVKEEAEPVLSIVRAALPLEAMAQAQARGAARVLEEVVGEILAASS